MKNAILCLSLMCVTSGCAFGVKQFGVGMLGARYEYNKCETAEQCVDVKAGAGMCTKSRSD
jgi:hypothetical protein